MSIPTNISKEHILKAIEKIDSKPELKNKRSSSTYDLIFKGKNKMVAFLMPSVKSKDPLYKFVVSVDSIEKMTGIDFFPQLPDNIENDLETKSDYKAWAF